MSKRQKTVLVVISLLCLSLVVQFSPTTADSPREIMRLGRGTANALDWRPDGKVLAVASATGVWILDESLNIIDHQEPVESIADVAWSPNGHQIALTGQTGQECHTQIWDAEFKNKSGDIAFCGHELKWSSDGKYLAIFNQPETQIALVENQSGTQIATLVGQTGVWSLDGKQLITATDDLPSQSRKAALYIWDAQTGTLLTSITGDNYSYSPLLWTDRVGKIFVACNAVTDDIYFHIRYCQLDVNTGDLEEDFELSKFHIGDGGRIVEPQWNYARQQLGYIVDTEWDGFLDLLEIFNPATQKSQYLSNGEIFTWKTTTDIITNIVGNGLIQNIDVITGDVLQEKMLFTDSINSIAWSPSGEQIASVGFGYEQDVRIWDVKQAAYEPELRWHVEPAESVFYTPDSKELVTAGTIYTDIIINHDISAWNADTGERSRSIDGFYSQFDPFPLIAWNKDFTQFVRSDRDNKVKISEDLTVITAGSQTADIIWNVEDTQIATVSSNGENDFNIEIWDIATGQRQVSFDFPNEVQVMNWSPDGSKLVIQADTNTSEDTLILDAKTGEVLQSFLQSWGGVWSVDSRFIAVYAYSIQSVVFWDSITSKRVETQATKPMTALAFSPDGTMLAVGMDDGTIRIWDVSDLQ
ncbi:MAG: WD40 repeat domain-containing protein [Chloroflexota bacterium]